MHSGVKSSQGSFSLPFDGWHISNGNKTILTDPWYDVPSFNGAWIQYPPVIDDWKSIKPDLIFITHEHSDHFHLKTLKGFKNNIPIYFPAFPNKRIEKDDKKETKK